MYKWSPYHRRYLYYRNKWPANWCNNYYTKYRWSPHYYRYLCDRYYNSKWLPSSRRYYFDDLYLDLKYKMDMFKSFLDSLPKNRSDFVNDLEIPEDILKNRPYVRDLDEELSSLGSLSSVCTIEELKPRVRSPLSTDSSISMSRAMTDSEIEFELQKLKKFKNRRLSDPFHEVEAAIQAFPEEYLVSISSFPTKPPDPEIPSKRERLLHNEELARKMTSFFDEECRVFSPDDPGLLDLEEALDSIDLKEIDLDLLKVYP